MSGHHILFISSWYPDRRNPAHGIFNRAFAEAVARRSRVSVLHVSPDDNISAFPEPVVTSEPNLLTVNVFYRSRSGHGMADRLRQFFRRRNAYRKGFRIIREKAGLPSVVQLNVVFPAGSEALRISKKYRLPLVINECWTGYDPLDGRYDSPVIRIFSHPVFKHAKVIMPVTSYLERLMRERGIDGTYSVVPNVVDTGVFRPADGGGEVFHRLIHISALDDAQKNVSGIIEAFAAARSVKKELHLVIVGNGPDEQRLKKKAATLLPHGGITFKGRLSPAEVAAEIKRCDALVMFSNYETLCVAVPEALACGVPVITSDAGGIMSYFDENFGMVVPKGDVTSLSGAIGAFYDNVRKFDRKRMREFAVSNFSAEKVCNQLHDVYDTVTGKK